MASPIQTTEMYEHNGKRYKRIVDHWSGAKDTVIWKVQKPETDTPHLFERVMWFKDEPTEGQLENELVLSSH